VARTLGVRASDEWPLAAVLTASLAERRHRPGRSRPGRCCDEAACL